MVTDLDYKKAIVKWIVDNPGYVYSQFTFIPEHDNDIIPTQEEFETLTNNFESWNMVEEAVLSIKEQELYPGATQRRKYIFTPLNNNLYAQVFANKENVLYIVIGV